MDNPRFSGKLMTKVNVFFNIKHILLFLVDCVINYSRVGQTENIAASVSLTFKKVTMKNLF